MGKLIQTKFNPETGKLERTDRKSEPVFNNKRRFIVEEAFDIVQEGDRIYVPVEAYELGFEEDGLYSLEVGFPTLEQAKLVKKGTIVES